MSLPSVLSLPPSLLNKTKPPLPLILQTKQTLPEIPESVSKAHKRLILPSYAQSPWKCRLERHSPVAGCTAGYRAQPQARGPSGRGSPESITDIWAVLTIFRSRGRENKCEWDCEKLHLTFIPRVGSEKWGWWNVKWGKSKSVTMDGPWQLN